MITKEGKSRKISSGNKRRWDSATDSGGVHLHVLNPEEDDTIHMEDNWVESADWQFIALSATSKSVVVSFDTQILQIARSTNIKEMSS